VLYAPTWEGWGDDEHHTSLVNSGERIITALLEASVPVRVIYKPHPLTGTRSAAAGAAHARVVSALAAHRDGHDHRVVTGATPTLHECFNHAHLLIADVSSVVADWIASQKPYAVVNSRGVPETTFHTHYPSTAAAYLVSADAGEVEKVLRVVREGPDPLTAARRDLARYLLGPAEPSSQERFAAQIRRILGQRRAAPRSAAQWRALNQARPSDEAPSMVDIP
jgi:CDP-glycerol glycerophosphotransferase (TagB/SpsB family)